MSTTILNKLKIIDNERLIEIGRLKEKITEEVWSQVRERMKEMLGEGEIVMKEIRI